MKAYKLELLVIDSENTGPEDIKNLVENTRYIYPKVMSITGREIGEWHDDHPLNRKDCHEAFASIFNTEEKE